MSAAKADTMQPIERGGTSDLPEVHALNERLLPEAWSLAALGAAVKRGADLLVWRTVAGRLAAYYLGQDIGNDTHMLQLAVDQRYQRQGLALALCRHVIADKRNKHIQHIYLEVRESNRAALGLYRTLGFCVAGRRPAYYAATGDKPQEDALLLTMRL